MKTTSAEIEENLDFILIKKTCYFNEIAGFSFKTKKIIFLWHQHSTLSLVRYCFAMF
jgi:hypothetical protein